MRDAKVNFDNIKKMYHSFVNDLGEKPERGLLIGSKDIWRSEYSRPTFKELKTLFCNNMKNVTIFEKHTNKGTETNMHYSAKTDTNTINTRIFNPKTNRNEDVLTEDGIKKSFEKIVNADGDEVYINGKPANL